MPVEIKNEILQQAVDQVERCGGNMNQAMGVLGWPITTLKTRLAIARRRGLTPSPLINNPNDPLVMKGQIRRLTDELKKAQQEALNHTIIREKILQLNRNVTDTDVPTWMVKELKKADSPGVPTVFLSDLHWAEVVDPKQINGVNKYNIEIANKRLERLAERTLRLCGIISPTFDYPGIVVPLGGDCYSGNIHDELTATNEINSMPAVLDLFAAVGAFIKTMLTRFDHVFVPCVGGNHSRDTHKTWSKDRHATSFDWLTYCLLAKHFENDPRVTFLIPDGPDAYYRIYHHRYILNHGDSFKGGDGMIGPLGPVMRGSLKKASRNTQINMEFDTMIIGHFHTEVFTRKVIMNGSLVGYNEFAYGLNLPFEPPSQQLWITHPRYGLTFRMPVLVEEVTVKGFTRDWVSVAA